MQLFPESAMPPSAPAGPDSRSARMARLLENLVECDGGAEEQRILPGGTLVGLNGTLDEPQTELLGFNKTQVAKMLGRTARPLELHVAAVPPPPPPVAVHAPAAAAAGQLPLCPPACAAALRRHVPAGHAAGEAATRNAP